MKNNQVESKHPWFSIEQDLTFANPETVLKWTNDSFVLLVDIILNSKRYDDLDNADEVRLEHLRTANAEYKECVTKLTALIKAERGERNETTSINSTGQTNCEKVS